MNPFFLIFIGLPALEIFLLIKIGGKIGALNTVSLIFLTAIIGIYFAKQQGIKTIRSGVTNLYQNKTPIYEIITGASIAVAAALLIMPGFFTDTVGFLLLIPLSRKILINFLIKKNRTNSHKENNNTLDGEIIEDKKDEL
mgnify:FL=1|tara:strand:- start:335 stop:754 length:420 start_codon:yes stop_codon:yes gene_type:complete